MSKILVLLIAVVQLQLQVVVGGGHAAYDYDNQGEWGGDCNKESSTSQSPVDVVVPQAGVVAKGKLVELSDKARDTRASNLNDNSTIKFSFSETITYKIPGLENTAEVKQLHLHWGKMDTEGSEHLLNGHHLSAEAHLVTSYDNGARFAVIARLFKAGKENDQIEKMIDSANSDSDDDREINHFNLTALYPSDITQVVTYPGSLTTPDCSEIVHWIIVPEPLTVSTDQLKELRKVPLGAGKGAPKTYNWRKKQKLNDRSFTKYISSTPTFLPSSLLMVLIIIMY